MDRLTTYRHTTFSHIRIGSGRVTAAIRYVDEDDIIDEKAKAKTVVMVATAWCNPRDNFSKKKGRLISEGRLNAGKVEFTLACRDDVSVKFQVAQKIVSLIAAGVYDHNWIFETASAACGCAKSRIAKCYI